MVTPSPASAVSDSVADSATSPNTLHHNDWLVLQTGLGHAPRSVLHTIVQQHAGFQRNSYDDTFYMLRSRLEPVLPRGMQWRTFTNHRSALVKLGLLELVWRAPNQHTDRSLWRLRYDQIISAQPCEQLALPIDDLGNIGDHASEGIPVADKAGGDAVQEERTASSRVPSNPSGERQSLLQQIDWMKAWLARLEARLEALASAEREPESEGNVEEGSPLPRAERRRRERVAAKGSRKRSSKLPDESVFMQSVSTAMDRLDVRLSEYDQGRFRDVEAQWRSDNPDAEVPPQFLQHALRRAEEEKPERYIGYIIGTLRNTLQQGYIEDDPPERIKQGAKERYPPRTNNTY